MSRKRANWLAVSTHLKHISQIGSFPQVGMKIKKYWKPPPRFLWAKKEQSSESFFFQIQTTSNLSEFGIIRNILANQACKLISANVQIFPNPKFPNPIWCPNQSKPAKIPKLQKPQIFNSLVNCSSNHRNCRQRAGPLSETQGLLGWESHPIRRNDVPISWKSAGGTCWWNLPFEMVPFCWWHVNFRGVYDFLSIMNFTIESCHTCNSLTLFCPSEKIHLQIR